MGHGNRRPAAVLATLGVFPSSSSSALGPQLPSLQVVPLCQTLGSSGVPAGPCSPSPSCSLPSPLSPRHGRPGRAPPSPCCLDTAPPSAWPPLPPFRSWGPAHCCTAARWSPPLSQHRRTVVRRLCEGQGGGHPAPCPSSLCPLPSCFGSWGASSW